MGSGRYKRKLLLGSSLVLCRVEKSLPRALQQLALVRVAQLACPLFSTLLQNDVNGHKIIRPFL